MPPARRPTVERPRASRRVQTSGGGSTPREELRQQMELLTRLVDGSTTSGTGMVTERGGEWWAGLGGASGTHEIYPRVMMWRRS